MDVKDIIKWLLSQKSPQKPSKTIVLLILATSVVLCKAHSSSAEGHSVANSSGSDVQFNSDVQNRTEYFERLFKSDQDLVKQRIRSLMFTTTKCVRDYLRNLDANGVARTFGRPIKQLQAALLPVMFKLGVISTLVVLTFILVVKAVGLGMILLMFKVAGALAKVKSLLGESHHHHGHGWSPHKEVHVHVHGTSGLGAEGFGSLFAGGHDQWHRFDSNQVSSNYAPDGLSSGSYPSLTSNKLSSFYNHHGPSSINTPYGQYIRVGEPTAPASF